MSTKQHRYWGEGARVALPAWSDVWMQGDRYGVVEREFLRRYDSHARIVAFVRLDSGRHRKFFSSDLEPVNPCHD